MACFDLEMQLCAAKSLASAITSDVYDFGQPHPNSGAWAKPIYLVIHPTVNGTGTGAGNSVVFAIEDSADNSSFAEVLKTATIAGEEITEDIVIPLPVKHRQYVRLKTTVAGTVTGTIDAYLATSFDLPMAYKKEGIDVISNPEPESVTVQSAYAKAAQAEQTAASKLGKDLVGVTGTLGVSNGGTGATDAAGARTNLGAAAAS